MLLIDAGGAGAWATGADLLVVGEVEDGFDPKVFPLLGMLLVTPEFATTGALELARGVAAAGTAGVGSYCFF